ncbi:MAG: hypothetical protein M1837_003405 [Sclerophora amabilis]|nr:MAG: hypothetical protein M1837_003405 [Sclerophora amabilis]
MRLDTLFRHAFLFSSLSVQSSAIPVLKSPPIRSDRISRRAYSVVAVDGGSSTLSTPTVATEVRTVTESITASDPPIVNVITTKLPETPETVTKTRDAAPVATGPHTSADEATVPKAATTNERSTHVTSASTPQETVRDTVTHGTTVHAGAPAQNADTSSKQQPTHEGTKEGTKLASQSSSAQHSLSSTIWQPRGGMPLPTAPTSSLTKSYDNGQWHSSYLSWNRTSSNGGSLATPTPVTLDSPTLEERAVATPAVDSSPGDAAVRRSVPAPSAEVYDTSTRRRRAAVGDGSTWNKSVAAREGPVIAAPDASIAPDLATQPTPASQSRYPGKPDIMQRERSNASNPEATISSSTASSHSAPRQPTLSSVTAESPNPTEIPSTDVSTHERRDVPVEIPDYVLEAVGRTYYGT